MHIIVAGCGKIGTTIVSSLVKEGHDVVAIDQSAEVITELNNVYDVMAVCGNSTDCNTLAEAGVEKAELFISLTGSDEMNMLSCFIARKMGAGYTIARIRNPEYNDESLTFLRQNLDISMAINPEQLTARAIYNILKLPSAMKIETFSQGSFEMIELRLKQDSPMIGQTLWQLRKKYQANFLICCVQREDNVIIPDGTFVLQTGDRIGLIAAEPEIQKLLRLMGLQQKKTRSVMLLGAGRIAYYLARLLLEAGNSVKVIEKDEEKCKEFCQLLPRATTIHGDGARQELLNEEGLPSTDAFVALTGQDEQNILLSFYANSQKVSKVIGKVNRGEFAAMADRLGLDCTISPRNIVADVLVQYARALQNSMGSSVETLYKLMDGKAEALEFIVRDDFPGLQIPLKELPVKSNILLVGILRSRRAIIPTGDDCILSGDRVVVLSAGHRLHDLSDILK